MEQTTTKGATLLKVTGILMIIGGAISVVMSIIAVAGIARVAAPLPCGQALAAVRTVAPVGGQHRPAVLASIVQLPIAVK